MSGVRKLPPLAAALLWISSAAAPAHADGPGAYRPPARPNPPAAISEQDAMMLRNPRRGIDAYNTGYAAILRADHAQALAGATRDAKEKAAAERDARDAFKESLRHFETAVRLDASMHEAFTYLGYANRKLGRHAKALDAYQQALRINPDYPHAIEYQGQAFLGLNRIDEARFNYLRLYALNRGQAAKLLQAMREWVDAHRTSAPDGIDVNAFAEWVTQRAELTRHDAVSTSW